MKANEFIRWHGLLESKKHLEWMARVGARRDIHGWFMDDLKRLIESHDLVEHAGGLDSAKKQIELKGSEDNCLWCVDLKIAIADVESCQ